MWKSFIHRIILRISMNKTTLFILVSLCCLFPFRVKAQNNEKDDTWAKKSLLVYNPVWENEKDVPEFIKAKLEKIVVESNNYKGWSLQQVGYFPLVMRSKLERAETNYKFEIWVSEITGKEIVREVGKCLVCSSTEAADKLKETKKTLIDKLNKIYKDKNKGAESDSKKKADQDKKKTEASQKKVKIVTKIKYQEKEPGNFNIPQWDHPSPPKKLWFYGATSISAISVITGITLLAINQNPSCDKNYSQQCSERYSTGAAGWAFMTTGLVAGGVAWYLYYKINGKSNSESSNVSIYPVVGSQLKGLGLSWNF
jgi:hypothetical protein